MGSREQKVYVSQKAILFNDNGEVLTMRRTKTAPSSPLHWDLPGGDIEFGEDLKSDIAREIREETGLEVQNLKVMDAVGGFNDRKEFWVTVCYTARLTLREIKLSYEHDAYKWVTPDEFLKLKISPRIREFIEHYRKTT